jgi:putative transposase
MKRTRFSDEQIVGILQEAAGPTTAREVCRQHGITETTFYRWRAKYGGMPKAEIRRLKQLEDENRRLKKLVADLSLDVAMLKDVAGRNW